ncbi:chromate efflux transporter [Egibacter rhizosphaerae]|uniref:Chromate efflux transporter n=1 Tax=Egibacter rhizosphaerae TaxID=1670831 RepID=A0A411YEG5_9ACTN|nr:chromate efflux transporter [Egibacter rhizosphaerae]QBI19598.1 chromate efflux transporter [Egibacter rhizosphaerae]
MAEGAPGPGAAPGDSGDDGGDEGAPRAPVRAEGAHQPEYAERTASWPGLLGVFLKLGVVAFGGPVAHIAMMDKEVVERRRWVHRQHFLDVMAATNLLPGPNSTQMTMHIGYVQRGTAGVWAAGSAFILPAALITFALTWLYVELRDLPAMDAVFYGVQPVVIAVIATAMVRLAPTAASEWRTRGVFAGALALGLLGVNELVVLALGALAGVVLYRWRPWQRRPRRGVNGMVITPLAPWLATTPTPTAAPDLVWQLAWLFAKFGVTLFGSGYLLVAYLQTDIVDRFGLLTTEQLIEAIVIGEMTPGPLFTVSTAVGYMVGDVPGAVVATVAIFFPSFFLAMLLGRWMPAIKRSEVASAVLKGLTAAVLGVMLAVAVEIGMRVIVDVPTGALALAALAALVWTRVSAILLIPIGGLLGYLWITFVA